MIISTSGPVSAVYLYFSLHQFSFLKLYKFSDASHHSLLSVKVNSHCMRCGAVCRWLVSVCLSVCLCRSQVGVCIEMAARIDLGFFMRMSSMCKIRELSPNFGLWNFATVGRKCCQQSIDVVHWFITLTARARVIETHPLSQRHYTRQRMIDINFKLDGKYERIFLWHKTDDTFSMSVCCVNRK